MHGTLSMKPRKPTIWLARTNTHASIGSRGWAWMTSPTSPTSNWTPEEDEQWWAIAFPDGTTRPAYAAPARPCRSNIGNRQAARTAISKCELMIDWILTLSYWIHLLATVVWLGGMVLLAVIAWPWRGAIAR